jgi:hypothetical protein
LYKNTHTQIKIVNALKEIEKFESMKTKEKVRGERKEEEKGEEKARQT